MTSRRRPGTGLGAERGARRPSRAPTVRADRRGAGGVGSAYGVVRPSGTEIGYRPGVPGAGSLTPADAETLTALLAKNVRPPGGPW